jgi:hypothetical protein
MVSGNPNFNETIRIQLEACIFTTVEPLPHLRFEIPEAARILRISAQRFTNVSAKD